MPRFMNIIREIETVDGEVVDDLPGAKTARVDVVVTHNGTHAAVGRIVAERYAQRIAHKQRMRDAVLSAIIIGEGILAASRAAASQKSNKREGKGGNSGASGRDARAGGKSSTNHSCTDEGDWGEYGAW